MVFIGTRHSFSESLTIYYFSFYLIFYSYFIGFIQPVPLTCNDAEDKSERAFKIYRYGNYYGWDEYFKRQLDPLMAATPTHR